MASAVAYVVSWSSRHRATISAATLAIVLVSLAGIRGLSFDTDVLSLLPRDGTAVPAFRKFLATFGSLDQLYIVFIAPSGQSITDYEEQIDAWIDALRQAPEIVRVDSGTVDASRDVRWLADHQLLLFPDSALTQSLARFDGAGMRQAIASRRQLLEVPSPEITELVRQDPLGLLDVLRDQLGGSPAGLHIGVTGRGYVTTDGRRRLIIAQPSRPPFDSDFSHALFARLAAIQDTVSKRPPADQPAEGTRPRLEVEIAGGHRIALETEATVRRESISNTVGSLALILPLLYIVFRSPWLIAVGSLPSIIALLIVLGAFGLAGVTLSVATAASAAMLFGLGIDGVVLLYVAYNRAIAAGADPLAAIDGLASPSFSMLLGMWTTAATFYGLVFVDFPSLTQLGQLIGHSMMLCGFLTLVLVPATLRRRKPRHPARSLSMPTFSERVQRHRRMILWGALILTVGLGAAATKLRINPTLDRLKSVTPGAVLQERLTSMFGLPGEAYVVIDEGPDLESLLAANERLMAEIARTTPAVLVEGASTLLPSQATQSQRAVRIQEAGLSSAAVATALADAGAQAGFRVDAFDPFRERLPRLLDATQRLTYQGYHEHGLGDLLDRFVAKTGTGWRLASYAFPSTDAQVAAIETAIRSVDRTATMTGVPFVNRELAARFLPQFVRGVVIGTAIVILIVVSAFRDWWLSLLALLPTAIGLIWAAGVLGLAGSELDLFAVFAVVTFVGIGVDYGIHLVQRYRETGDAMRAVEELAPVILVAAGITMLGYGTLVTSSYPPLRSIGLVSSVSVAALSVASVIVLPALLMRNLKR